jgi:hypothetical protein
MLVSEVMEFSKSPFSGTKSLFYLPPFWLFIKSRLPLTSRGQNPDSAKSRLSTDFSDLEKISRYQGYSLLEASQSRRTPHRLKPLRWGFRNRRVCCNPMSRTQLSNNFSGFCTLNNVQLWGSCSTSKTWRKIRTWVHMTFIPIWVDESVLIESLQVWF